jgi:NAD+ diphosphatase
VAFIPSLAPEATDRPAWWLPFFEGQVYVRVRDGRAEVPIATEPTDELGLAVDRAVYLGSFDGRDAFGAALAAPPGEDLAPVGLRALYGMLEEDLFALAGRAFQLLEWDRTHRFCGVCGTPTEPSEAERALRCPSCGHLHFPRVSPAVIVRVDRGDEVLLAHGVAFPEGVYSVIAGFVEPGETLEQAVAREVREETAIDVADVTYFGSQPWPFPHQLMIGFTAAYRGGELRPDATEIADAGWFGRDRLPSIPPKLSIARRLIDDFLGRG